MVTFNKPSRLDLIQGMLWQLRRGTVLEKLTRFLIGLPYWHWKVHGTLNAQCAQSTIRLLEELNITPKHLIDCGANVGGWSVHLTRKWPNMRLTSIEPHPRFTPPGELIRVCLSDKAEVIRLVSASENARGPSDGEPFDFESTTTRLDDLDLKIDLPLVLKIDCEQFTSRVMRGAASALNKASVVVVEMWNDAPWTGPKGRFNEQQAEIWECAICHGFKRARIVDFCYSRTSIGSYDLAFYR